MPSAFPAVRQNVREEVVSDDWNRAQALQSQAIQNELMHSVLDTNGIPINCFTRPATASGVAGAFKMAVTAGEALMYDAAIVDPDASPMQVLQWDAQQVTLAAPDPVLGRVDLVVATPGVALSDFSVRYVAVEGSGRSSPSSVPKTQRPTATLSVVTGTPAATPLPPAVPSGSVAIFEVLAEPGSTDSQAWPVCLRLFRETGYPYTGMVPAGETFSGGSGVSIVYAPKCKILRGCRLADVADLPKIAGSGVAAHAVVIDGEAIEFGVSDLIAAPDTLHPPAGPAPVNNDLPCYVFVVGGRRFPSSDGNGNPVQLVVTTTPPDITTGRPSAPIGTSRGTTTSAVFVGLAMLAKATSNFRGVDQRGSWFWSGAGGGFFSQNQDLVGGAYTINGAPSIADEMVLGASLTFPGTGPAQLTVGDWEDTFENPGAMTKTTAGLIRTRINEGVVNVGIVGLSLVRTGVQAYRLQGLADLGTTKGQYP